MQRRGLLMAVLAGATAPAFVRASSLMRVVMPPQEIIIPKWRFGGFTDSMSITRGVNGEHLDVYSKYYNMQAARQDEFGEVFFPTMIISPSN